METRRIEQNLRNKNFGNRIGNFEKNAVVKNQGTKQRVQRILGDCWQWESNGQCSRGDNCSFRHDMYKRGKSTQPNPSPRSSTQQNVKHASRIKKSQRQKPKWENGSTAVQGLPQRNLHQSILWKMASSGVLVVQVRKKDANLGISALKHTARLTNSLARSLKRMVTILQWLFRKLHDNWVAYLTTWSRRSLHRFCGRAQTYWSQSDVFDSPKPCYLTLTFERPKSIPWNDLPRWSSSA